MSSPPIGDKRVEIFPDLIPGSKPIPPGLVDAGSLLMVSLVDTCPVEAFGDFTSVLGGDGFSLNPLSKVPARVSFVKEPHVASRKRMGTISLGRLGAMFRRVVTKGFGVGVVPGVGTRVRAQPLPGASAEVTMDTAMASRNESRTGVAGQAWHVYGNGLPGALRSDKEYLAFSLQRCTDELS